MRVFGCAWKINFPEIIFSWLCVLKALTRKWFEVKIFTSNHFRTHAQRERERERAFDFDFVDFANHSLQLRLCRSTNQSCLRLCRSRFRLRRLRRSQPLTSTSPIYEPTDLWTDHAFDFANFADHAFDFADLWTDLRTHESIFDPEPSTHEPSTSPATQSLRATNRSSTQSHEPTNRSLSLCDFDFLCDFLCDFDRPTNPRAFDLWFFCCCCGGVGGGVLVVILFCGGGFCVGGGGK